MFNTINLDRYVYYLMLKVKWKIGLYNPNFAGK